MEYINILSLLIVVLCCLNVSARGTCVSENCRATTGKVCNGHGTCECGTCRCEGSYHGPTCEQCPTCRSPCEIFADCVSCKIFNTGRMSFMDCLQICDAMATFYPVEKTNFAELGREEGMFVCQRMNEMYCMESFKVGSMTQGYRDLFVQTQMDCEVERPPVIEPEVKTTTLEPIQIETTATTTTPKPTTQKPTTQKPTTPKPTTQKPTTSTMKATTVKPATTTQKKKMPKDTKVVELENEHESAMNDEGDANKYGKPVVADAVAGASGERDSNSGGSRARDVTVSALVGLCIAVVAIL